MILSRSREFIFIKGRKVAGTSLEALLAQFCGDEDTITPITAIDEKLRLSLRQGRGSQNYSQCTKEEETHRLKVLTTKNEELGSIATPKGTFFNHMSLQEIQREIGPIDPEYFIFALTRNPYRKVISFAHMQLSFSAYRVGRTFSATIDCIQNKVDDLIKSNSILHLRNIDLYKNTNGEIEPELFRYELLNTEVPKILNRIGVTDDIEIPHLKRGANASEVEVKHYLTKNQISIITDTFSDEFEAFGYSIL